MVDTNPAANQSTTIISSLNSINDSLSTIKNVLQNQIQNTLDRQRRLVSSRTREDRQRRQTRDKKLNTKKKNFGLKDAKDLLPKVGILDFIRNFIFYTGFGFIVSRLIEHYPTIIGILRILGPVATAIEFIVGGLFNALATSIEIAYSKYDQIRKLVKVIGGENFEKAFDDLSSKLNMFLNILGIAIAASAAMLMDINKLRGNRIRGGPRGQPRAGGPTGGSPTGGGPTGAGGGPTGAGGRRPGARRRLLQRRINKIPKMGGAGKGIFGRIPIIGPLLTLGIRLATEKEPPAKSVVAAVGSGIGQALGAAAIGAIGTILGGGIASALTGPLGVWAGSVLGSMLGEYLGALLYDGIAGVMKSNKGESKIDKKAKGGRVGTTRTLKKPIKKTQPIQPKQSVPGKDIGGVKQIEKVFPNPKAEERKKNALQLLIKNANLFNKKKGDTIAQLMKFGADLQHGQKPDRQMVSSVASNLGIMVQNIVEEKAAKNMRSILGQVFAAADGGYVPATRTLKVEGDVAKEFKKTFETMLNQAINNIGNDIFKNLRKEIGIPEPTEPGSNGEGVPIEIELGSFSSDDIDLLGKMIHAEAGGEPDEGKAAVMNVILNRYRLIKAGRSPGTFSIRQGVNKNNVTLRDILSAPSQFSPWSSIANNRVSSEQGKNALDKAISAGGRQPNKLKQILMSKGFSESDATFIVGTTYFSTNGQAMPGGPEIRLHGHVFEKAGVEVPMSLLTEIPARITRTDIGPVSGGSQYSYGVYVLGSQGSRATSFETLDPHRHRPGSTEHGPRIDFTIHRTSDNKYEDLPVVSPVDGVVYFTGNDVGGYGHYLKIRASNPSDGTVLMAHFSRLTVSQGQRVIAFDTVVGLQGSTGTSSGHHVHMEAKRHVITRYVGTLSSRSRSSPLAAQRQNQRASISTPSAQIASMVIPVGGPSANAATFETSIPSTQITAASNVFQKGEPIPVDRQIFYQPLIVNA